MRCLFTKFVSKMTVIQFCRKTKTDRKTHRNRSRNSSLDWKMTSLIFFLILTISFDFQTRITSQIGDYGRIVPHRSIPVRCPNPWEMATRQMRYLVSKSPIISRHDWTWNIWWLYNQTSHLPGLIGQHTGMLHFDTILFALYKNWFIKLCHKIEK